ncbi:hypothetical protein [Streptomyces sp. AD55]|uniref:hypothetical protein n=1 Tax=Streptomyces sp. AD55 TaxID=3242895 RepID=UPI0035294483
MRYATIADVIDQAIAPALGEYGNDYDLVAIAREAFAYRVDTDADGNELLNTAGFERMVDEASFWAIAEKHTMGANDGEGSDLGPTAWLGVLAGVLLYGEGPEVMVLDHREDGSAPEVMPSTALPVSLDDHDAACDAAETALKAAGWEPTGDWDAVGTGYTIKVRRA